MLKLPKNPVIFARSCSFPSRSGQIEIPSRAVPPTASATQEERPDTMPRYTFKSCLEFALEANTAQIRHSLPLRIVRPAGRHLVTTRTHGRRL